MTNSNLKNPRYSGWQLSALTITRVLIGWHFLYEGLFKLFSPAWSSKSYLEASLGPFSSFFKSIAQSDSLIQIVDFLNIWGLTIIGLCLLLGLFTRLSTYLGMLLLLFYYISYPPFGGVDMSAYVDGNYWIVNRNLIELGTLFILAAFPSGHITGLDRFLCHFWQKRKSTSSNKQQTTSNKQQTTNNKHDA